MMGMMGMVGQTGVDPVIPEGNGFTARRSCRFATDAFLLSTANKEDLLNLLAGAMAYHVCQPLINNFYSRARWLVRTILHRKPTSKTPKSLSF